MGTSIINPKGLNAAGGVYPDEIYANFPVMLRRLSYIYILLAGIGAIAIRPPPAARAFRFGRRNGAAAPAGEGISVWDALKSKKFWLMWFMVRCC